jgi:arylsulfatase A-like enzyme
MKKLTAIAALVLTMAVAACSAAAAARPPNFIVILTDDQGWGTTSVMMDPLVPESKSDFFKTPNIERLAASGMRFTQAYASHCNCSPSRAALQTGRSPAALHLTDIIERQDGPNYEGNKLIPPHHASALPATDKTIPQLLREHDAAYRAAHFGKWHLAAGGPEKFGYDESDGPTGNREGGMRTNLPDDPKKTFSITRKAIGFMQEQVKAGHPFYLQVSYFATHSPNQSRPATREELRNTPKGERHQNVPYGAMLADLDTGIGELLDEVKAAGISDNTYIIYTSDNGSVPSNDLGSLNGPLHGYKAMVWEGGIRVPFMVVGPGVKAGSLSRTPVVGYDILPTVCELAGMNAWPKVVEGGSLKPVLHGDGSATIKRPGDFLVFHWPHYQQARKSTPDTTILADGWKLHYWWETRQTQLFHLDKDLGESQDVAAEQPERVSAMQKLLTNYLATVRAQLPVPNPDYKPETDPALNRSARPGRNAANDAD